MCHSCWRGQAYCCLECKKIAQREAHRHAQRRYRQTEKGREAHRQLELQRRIRKNSKSVDDTSSPYPSCSDNPPNESCASSSKQEIYSSPKCHFCGATGTVINQFPRNRRGRIGGESSAFLRRRDYLPNSY